jgi:hypothetical protein
MNIMWIAWWHFSDLLYVHLDFCTNIAQLFFIYKTKLNSLYYYYYYYYNYCCCCHHRCYCSCYLCHWCCRSSNSSSSSNGDGGIWGLTPWFQSAKRIYRPSDCHLSAKLVPTLVERECRVVSAINPHRPEPQFPWNSSSIILMRLSGPHSRPTVSQKIW